MFNALCALKMIVATFIILFKAVFEINQKRSNIGIRFGFKRNIIFKLIDECYGFTKVGFHHRKTGKWVIYFQALRITARIKCTGKQNQRLPFV